MFRLKYIQWEVKMWFDVHSDMLAVESTSNVASYCLLKSKILDEKSWQNVGARG